MVQTVPAAPLSLVSPGKAVGDRFWVEGGGDGALGVEMRVQNEAASQLKQLVGTKAAGQY